MIVGVLGGGQLGRMLALAGYPLGLRFRFFDSVADACAGEVGELVVGDFSDARALSRFAEGIDRATYEFENVPVAAARLMGERVPASPPPRALEVAQDRLAEKQLFQSLGVPTARFFTVDSREDLTTALEELGYPSVLKTRRMGYDGKGQVRINGPESVDKAWSELGGQPLILEEFVRFARELSLVCARGADGQAVFYPLTENHHRDGILRLSIAPAPAMTIELHGQAIRIGHALLRSLDYVGVMAVELFQVTGGLMANELAPRVHNSGHWTIDAAETSQFENHLRAVCGLPLGSTDPLRTSAMVNLIGEAPDLARLAAVPGARIHLYGKGPRPGRKLGHVTVRARDDQALMPRLAELQRVIGAMQRG